MFKTVNDKITSNSGYLQCLDSGMDWSVDWTMNSQLFEATQIFISAFLVVSVISPIKLLLWHRIHT